MADDAVPAPARPPVPEVLWQPARDAALGSRLSAFARWAHEHAGAPAEGVGVGPEAYDALWRWSTGTCDGVAAFWRALWEWDGVVAAVPPADGPDGILADAATSGVAGARWFPGVRLNHVDQVLRHVDAQPDAEAIVGVDEEGVRRAVTWAQLREQVGALAGVLRAHGVGVGDRVAAHLPSVPESVVALLATASLGAVWVAAGQDTAGPAAAARLGRTDPVALVVADGYRYGGRVHERGTLLPTWSPRAPRCACSCGCRCRASPAAAAGAARGGGGAGVGRRRGAVVVA